MFETLAPGLKITTKTKCYIFNKLLISFPKQQNTPVYKAQDGYVSLVFFSDMFTILKTVSAQCIVNWLANWQIYMNKKIVKGSTLKKLKGLI